MFERVWQFRAAAGREREFETVYGPAGAWAELFGRATGYRGTELRPGAGGPRDYLVIDRWVSRDAWDAFRREHAAEYERLDRRCEPLTEVETLVRESDGAAS